MCEEYNRPEKRPGKNPKKDFMKYCLTHPGEAILVPRGFYHGTCNLDAWTVAYGAQGHYNNPAFERSMIFGDVKSIQASFTAAEKSGKKIPTLQTLFHTAASAGNVEIADFLLRRGGGDLLFSRAAASSLLSRASDAPTVRTPVEAAASHGHLKMAMKLLDAMQDFSQGKDLDVSPACLAWSAASLGDAGLHVLKYVAERFGEKHTLQKKCRRKDARPGSLYEVALAGFDGAKATVQFLMSRNVKWEDPAALVEIAAGMGHTAAVELLLNNVNNYTSTNFESKNEKINLQKIKDRTLRTALSSGYEELVHLLLSKGADATTPWVQPLALHAAVKSGKVSLVRNLIEKGGCVVGRRDATGRTALDVALKTRESPKDMRDANNVEMMERIVAYLESMSGREDHESPVEDEERGLRRNGDGNRGDPGSRKSKRKRGQKSRRSRRKSKRKSTRGPEVDGRKWEL